MTDPERTPPTPPSGAAARWHAWHLHLGSAARSLHDRVIEDVIRPTVAETASDRPWFFIRYWQGGPHLRLRVGDLDDAGLRRTERLLRERLETAGKLAPDEAPVDPEDYRREAERLAAAGELEAGTPVEDLTPPGVHRRSYEPEYERYGGRDLMPAAERLFQLSSELVAGLLPRLPDQRSRVLAALRATMAAAAALGDAGEQAAYYAHAYLIWRQWGAAFGYGREQLDQLCGVGRGGTVRIRMPDDHGPFAGWHRALAEHARDVRRDTDTHPGRLVFSHVHMFHNRLGLTLVEELQTYARLTRAFPASELPAPESSGPAPSGSPTSRPAAEAAS
ncbi:thiopeptide-type bacteriocin biosynthesis protein [Streptomyces megasporus]|uniref:thiopeptide-type bacteriocin biosynthesis protein n=1 Tax=Streptomyces megasporus TaxID=44060 RepID=UPI00068DE909|nr:thiopeptide-type bacteriocin biosynthesis protein [Streptomyces megasporus]